MNISLCCCLIVFALTSRVAADFIHIAVNETLQIKLSCHQTITDVVTWSREKNGIYSNIITIRGDDDKKHTNPEYYSRYHSLADGSLVITNVKFSDSGRYYCNNETAVELTVIPSGTTIMTVRETENVTLKCPDEDEGSDDSKWSRQFGKIPQQRFQIKEKELILKDIKQEDTGLYYCGGKPAVFLNVTSRSATKKPFRTTTTTSTSTIIRTTPTTNSTMSTKTITTTPTTNSTSTTTITSTSTIIRTTPTTNSTMPTKTITTTTSTTMPTTTSATTTTSTTMPTTTIATRTTTSNTISTTPIPNEETLFPWLILVGTLIFLIIIIIITACLNWRQKCKNQEAGSGCHVYDEILHASGLQPDTDSPYSLIGPSPIPEHNQDSAYSLIGPSRPSPISGNNQDSLYSLIGPSPCFENNQDSPYSLIGPSPCSGNDQGSSLPANSTYILLEKPKAPTNHDDQL